MFQHTVVKLVLVLEYETEVDEGGSLVPKVPRAPRYRLLKLNPNALSKRQSYGFQTAWRRLRMATCYVEEVIDPSRVCRMGIRVLFCQCSELRRAFSY